MEKFKQFLRPTISEGLRVYIETYGCQMNIGDSEVVLSILKAEGFTHTQEPAQADLILINTCSIRDNAERRIWARLRELKKYKKRNRQLLVGIIGCMAERLKGELIEKGDIVDIVAGPDSYRDLPRLVRAAGEGSSAVNILLSVEETYAEISPVRLDKNGVSAFISIMRGCDNMCSYCVVPYTRGRERSRDPQTILREAVELFEAGYKEVTLLGQNVNSYKWQAEASGVVAGGRGGSVESVDRGGGIERGGSVGSEESVGSVDRGGSVGSISDHACYKDFDCSEGINNSAGGFGCQAALGGNIDFANLLESVASISPSLRVRFSTSHPKDLSDKVLETMRRYRNICRAVHLPAQSGSSRILDLMNRKYSREWYLDRIAAIRRYLPDCAISTDLITGFCTETKEDHLDTLSLMQEVGYEFAYMFKYSERPDTQAARHWKDDVANDIKTARLTEIINLQHDLSLRSNKKDIGKRFEVLIEGVSKRSDEQLYGRTSQNKVVVFDCKDFQIGDYVEVEITDCSSATLMGRVVLGK